MRWLFTCIAIAAALSPFTDARLRVSSSTRAGLVADALIVGHATCAGISWLLTEAPDLVEVSLATRDAVAHAVHPLGPDDRPWGLACLADGTLWTLANPRTTARIDPSGAVRERVALTLPRIALFGAGRRLLFQSMPMVAGAPALASSPPRQPLVVQPWPALRARRAGSREQELTLNLVNCGLSVTGWLPCWFAAEPRFTISDGVTTRTLAPPALQSLPVDRSAPIWDVAVSPNRVWLLATVPAALDHKRGGRWLVQTDVDGRERARLELAPPARLILTASDVACTLLAVDGRVLEVVAAP